MAVSNVELRVNATQAVTALRKVDGQAKKFNTTIAGTGGKLKATSGSLKVLPAGLIATGGGAKVAAGGFAALTAAAAPLLGPLIGISAAVGALTKVFGNLAAQDFASAKIKTLGVDADALKPKLATLSNELSGQASSLDLLNASYDVASAGFGETAELTDVLKAAQLGATGGFSELATVADATTSVLNAYGLSSDQAAKLVDGFIQTQNDGKIVVDQYAQQIGRLAPIAAGAGVGIDELNAAISTVTATGVPVESTFAGLRQVIAAIQKPTSEAAKAAEKLGIDFSATALSTKGLGGVLEELVAKGGASEETLAQFFGSVEARTALLPLVNDQLVSFNKNLENQANAQGKAAQASVTSSNTIQGQLTRLGSAFTNLTTEGSEFGIIIRETLKVAAVTVEALAVAVKLALLPFRQFFAVISGIGQAIQKEIGGDAIDIVVSLENSWIAVKEAVTVLTDNVIKFSVEAGKSIGKVVGFILKQFKKIVDIVNGNKVLRFIFGRVEMPKLNTESVDDLKDSFEGTAEASNKIVETNTQAGLIFDENTKKAGSFKQAINNATSEADKLKEKFMEIGQGIEQGIVSGLTDAVMGTKTLAQAAIGVLNDLKRKLVEVAMQRAVSGIGNFLGNALGGLFGGGGGILGRTAVGTSNQFVGSASAAAFRANGGPVSAGGSYIVGERGPELFTPTSSGMITANDKMGGGTTNVVTVNVDASGSSVSGNTPDAQQLGNIIGIAIQERLIKEKRSGGLLSK